MYNPVLLPSTHVDLHPCDYCDEPVSLDDYLYAKNKGDEGYYCDSCEWLHYFSA